MQTSHSEETKLNDHQNMAKHYIDEMVSSLKSYFGSRFTLDEYEAIAWIGLGNVNGEGIKTTAWENLSETEQERLINIFKRVNSDCDEDKCK